MNALDKIFPSAEKRFCAMHLANNLNGIVKSSAVRSSMWFAAKATTDYFFNLHMESLKKVTLKTLSPNYYSLHSNHLSIHTLFIYAF